MRHEKHEQERRYRAWKARNRARFELEGQARREVTKVRALQGIPDLDPATRRVIAVLPHETLDQINDTY